MIPASARFAGAVLIFAQTASLAQPVRNADGLFPTDRTPRASGPTAVVRVGTVAADEVRIIPVTFLSRPGTNKGEGSKSMCGLIIIAPGRRPQGIITVGTGFTEATPSCDGVLAVGALPASTGETIRRIGAIHAISSRNAVGGRAAVIVHRDMKGVWSVDADATAQADSISRYTIAELRRKLL